jgi:hypothetical protein
VTAIFLMGWLLVCFSDLRSTLRLVTGRRMLTSIPPGGHGWPSSEAPRT